MMDSFTPPTLQTSLLWFLYIFWQILSDCLCRYNMVPRLRCWDESGSGINHRTLLRIDDHPGFTDAPAAMVIS